MAIPQMELLSRIPSYGDAKDLAISQDFKVLQFHLMLKIFPFQWRGKGHHAPHMYFSHSSTGNGDIRNGNQDQQLPESFGSIDNWVVNQDENQLGCN
ncbi:uncharacterized protein Pyn_35307 [Prunus yedoensis var. nudiflora]|uniref:Uncharacterized protein n=1 Tax=Prunus yedoensis var. nudiflora TaxID=2094558 RepID=A0A314YBH9_PRUYE|nr:uncharacterized protein Pyn_35307 [Prunus yedoensis var. nudiflora]